MTLDPLAGHARLGLDSNVFIYLFETDGPEAAAAGRLLDLVEAGHLTACLSAIGVAEILSGPARAGDERLVDLYRRALGSVTGLSILAVDETVAARAAGLRASAGLTLPDAIHLASALEAGATGFVTNDLRLHGVPSLPVVPLTDFRPAAG